MAQAAMKAAALARNRSEPDFTRTDFLQASSFVRAKTAFGIRSTLSTESDETLAPILGVHSLVWLHDTPDFVRRGIRSPDPQREDRGWIQQSLVLRRCRDQERS